MQVSGAINDEAVFFCVSVLCGVGLVLLYDCFRIIRRLIPHGNLWIGAEDVCYWIFCTVSVFLLLYKNSDGMMRGFAFLGIAVGGVLYAVLLSRFVVKVCVGVCSWILKVLGKIFNVLGKPFRKTGRKILGFFKKQLKKLYKVIKMGVCKH